ncbi:MAG: efflux RND transporter permease subunit [Hyphomonadaceae bacterium]
MAWNISAGAIRNPIPPIVLIIALLFAGLTAYARLPVNQLPNIEFGQFNVVVAQPGAAPPELETQVTQRVEAALTAVDGVKRITSTITPGASTTLVELNSDADVNRAVDDARDALGRIRSDLPADITDPVIMRMDAASEPIAYFAIEGSGMSPQDLSWFIDNDLARDLLAVSGVSQVKRLGGVNREIRVQLDPARMQAYGVSADSVSQQLRAENIDLPGGQAELGGQAQSIRTLGGAETVAQLAQTRIQGANGRVLRLSDIANVFDGSSDLASITRYNGQPVVGFMIQRAKQASEVSVFDDAKKTLDAVAAAHPGMTFRLIGSPVEFIRGMHESSIAALLEGALLACAVVFLVLRDWRATLIAATAIPLSVIPTFAAIEPFGFTLNMITLIALALVAGVLVDDAIVEIENIVRHMRMGKSAYQAALEAADEIGLAVVATTATIIAVFLPVSFMTGNMGQFFKEFGMTVAFAAFFSLVIARLITPMLSAFFLKNKHVEEKPGAVVDTYRAVLAWAIRRPGATVGLGVLIFIVSLLMATQVPFVVIPRLDNGQVRVQVEAPPGTPLLEADRDLQRMADAVRGIEGVEGVFTSLESVAGAANNGSINVQLVPRDKRDLTAYDVQNLMRPRLARFANYRTTFVNFQGGGAGSDIGVQLVGQEPSAVNAAADRLVAAMRRMPMLADVKSSASLQLPEIQVRPRLEDARRLGVSSTDLAAAVRIATSGDVEQNLPRFDLADRQIPIRVLIAPDQRADLDTIKALTVRSALGPPVRLDAVADVSFALGEAAIERRDRQRSVTVSANIADPNVTLGTAQKTVFALPQAREAPEGAIPPGVHLATTGQTEDSAEMFEQFGTAMLWGVLLIYGVLVLLFRDFYQPLTIMTALPLSIGGAFAGLMLSNQPLSLFALIGLLMLMGLVTKNSILLVDFAIEQMHKGMSRNQALMEAGLKRARPIVMTTFAMTGGMIPAAAGWGVDGSLRQGMGAAVIGGLMLSTLLSLIFVPAVFVLVDRLERVLSPFFARFTTRERDAAAARRPAE